MGETKREITREKGIRQVYDANRTGKGGGKCEAKKASKKGNKRTDTLVPRMIGKKKIKTQERRGGKAPELLLRGSKKGKNPEGAKKGRIQKKTTPPPDS